MNTQTTHLREADSGERDKARTEYERKLRTIAETLNEAYDSTDRLEAQVFELFAEYHPITREARRASVRVVSARSCLAGYWNKRFPIEDNPFVASQKEGE